MVRVLRVPQRNVAGYNVVGVKRYVNGAAGGLVLVNDISDAALVAAAALILVYPYAPTQVGLAAVLIVAALAAFRACCIAARTASQ